jgi:glutaredoxin
MPKLLTILLFFSFFISATAQEEVEVYEKQDGNKVLLMAKNNLDEAVEVTLNVMYKGYTTKDVFPKVIVLKEKEEVIMTTLVIPPGTQCEYGTSVSYKKVNKTQNKRITRTTGVQINPVKVNVFTKDDCARCAFVIEQFEKNNVVFLELNTSIAPSNNELMFEKLKEAGYKDNQIQMPVVVHKGEVFYNIKDLKAFVEKFK